MKKIKQKISMLIKKHMKFLAPISFLFVSLSVFASSAQGATLNFSPSSGSYTAGSFITVNVFVSSTDQAMNAASGVVSFPTDLLSVSSVSEDGSKISFWAQQPTFSNTSGTVNFEGAIFTPGYTGNSGKLLTIIFKAKSQGTANLSFSSGSVLANDGAGTEIMTSSGSASFTITSGENKPTIIPAVSSGVPAAPAITSSTHPDSTKWYALSNANFSWDVTKDIIGSSILIDKNEKSSPIVMYNPPLSSKEIAGLADGIWYFHVQLKNDKGWSPVSNFKLQIDTQKPSSFDITEIKRDDPTDPSAKFLFSAVDETSGIDHFEVQIDNGTSTKWKDDGSHIYTAPAEDGGAHTLLAKAVDGAGNFITNSAQFNILALQAPVITDYPKELQSGDILTVKGTTKYFNSKIILTLQNENDAVKTYSSKASADGNFTVVSSDRLKDGIYQASAQVVDDRGAKSAPSESVTIAIKPSPFLTIGSWAINFLAVLISVIALIILIILLVWYAWRKFVIMEKKIKQEAEEENTLLKAYNLLKGNAEAQIKVLEELGVRRQLTIEEEEVKRHLKKALEEVEQYVKREIKDIYGMSD